MSPAVDLVLLGPPSDSSWRMGRTLETDGSLPSLAACWVDACGGEGEAEAFLVWDSSLGPPPSVTTLATLLEGPGDVWHGGLRLGLGGLPVLGNVAPTWMHGLDPDLAVRATSWRLSLRACLLRRAAALSLGGPDAGFESMTAAGLELGHRYLRGGAVVLHQPDLIARDLEEEPASLSVRDEIRWVQRRYGRRWALWALLRGVLTPRRPLTTVDLERPRRRSENRADRRGSSRCARFP